MGECKRCGACCKILPCLREHLAPETVEWLIARGGRVEGKYLLLPQVCQHLQPDNICDIHNTPEYPVLCKRYHGHGHFYKPSGCGYL